MKRNYTPIYCHLFELLSVHLLLCLIFVIVELDSSIGDIMSKITKRQSEIMLKLVRYINKHANSILGAIQLCAELDT